MPPRQTAEGSPQKWKETPGQSKSAVWMPTPCALVWGTAGQPAPTPSPKAGPANRAPPPVGTPVRWWETIRQTTLRREGQEAFPAHEMSATLK